MGNRPMPTVADFLDIQPVTPELVLELGYLPQCTFWDRDPNHPRGCGKQTEWTIDANYHCDEHKRHVELWWEKQIAELVARPAGAKDSDLKLLELIRDEFPDNDRIYPHVAVKQIVKDLALPDDPKGRNLAAWYLWEMGIFNIHKRATFYEQS